MRWLAILLIIIIMSGCTASDHPRAPGEETNSPPGNSLEDGDASNMQAQPLEESSGAFTGSDTPAQPPEQSVLLEEMRAYLSEIPYTALNDDPYQAKDYPYVTDEVGKQLADFIAGIVYFNPITAEGVDDDFILRASIFATDTLKLWSDEVALHYPELDSLGQLEMEIWDEVIPKHHIDITAKELFGEDVVITDYAIQSTGRYIFYIEELEAYSISGFGAPVYSVPVILSYAEYSDYYEVIAAFASHTGEGFVQDGSMELLSDTQFKDYMEQKQKYRIFIGKKSGGGLYYQSHTAYLE